MNFPRRPPTASGASSSNRHHVGSSTTFAFNSGYGGDENRCELISLLQQRFEPLGAHDACVDQELQPVCCLVELLESHFQLADHLCRGSAPERFPVVSTYRRS